MTPDISVNVTFLILLIDIHHECTSVVSFGTIDPALRKIKQHEKRLIFLQMTPDVSVSITFLIPLIDIHHEGYNC